MRWTLLLLLAATPAVALEPHLSIDLGLGDVERRTVFYDCGDPEPARVQYVNAAPNFLAIVSVDDQPLLFVNVIAASGARYVAGQYAWWTDGPDASLYDLTAGDGAPPAKTCVEIIDTP